MDPYWTLIGPYAGARMRARRMRARRMRRMHAGAPALLLLHIEDAWRRGTAAPPRFGSLRFAAIVEYCKTAKSRFLTFASFSRQICRISRRSTRSYLAFSNRSYSSNRSYLDFCCFFRDPHHGVCHQLAEFGRAACRRRKKALVFENVFFPRISPNFWKKGASIEISYQAGYK